MKILIVTHYFHPHVGGIEIAVYNQAKEFIKRGDQVTVITSTDQSTEDSLIEKIKIIRVKATNVLEAAYQVPYPLFSPVLLAKMNTEMQKCDVVIIHGSLYLSSLVGAIYGKYYKKKVILIEHVGFVTYKSPVLNFAQSVAFRLIGTLVLKLSNKVFVLNREVKNYISKYTDKKIRLLVNGVDNKIFHPVTKSKIINLRNKYALPIDKKIILFVGRFVEKKGYRLLIESLEPKYFLILVGSGYIDKENLQENIKVYSSLGRDAIAELYQLSDIFVLPSRDEGFPLSILEAMASALPVITSGNYLTGVNRKLIKIIMPNRNNLATTIREILDDDHLANKMSEYSLKSALTRFTWKESIRGLKI